MKTSISLPNGLSLEIADHLEGHSAYPTGRLPKGLLLRCDGQPLAEEGVGFGVPFIQRGAQTIFPGGMELAVHSAIPPWRMTATYRMDLLERLESPRGASHVPAALYAARDSLAAVHRRVPLLRGPLSATSAAVRRQLGWVTTYVTSELAGAVTVEYTVHPDDGVVTMAVDAGELSAESGITEVVLMNELGASYFDRYEDSAGVVLEGGAIGTWDEITAERASFVSTACRVAFTLEQVPGARLRRGREVVAGRLAWAGFGYSWPPALSGFTCTLRVARTP